MPLSKQIYYPELQQAIFFDDFVAASYNNRIWAVTGTGSITSLSEIGGRLRVRANAGASYRFNHGNIGAYTIANNARAYWRARMLPATAVNGLVECGLQSVTNPTTDMCCWRYNPNTSANFLCVARSGANVNSQSSGVAGDNLDHIFGIECIPGSVLFYLDGVLRQTLSTYLTAENCQPFVNCTGSAAATSDIEPCWCDIRGTRA